MYIPKLVKKIFFDWLGRGKNLKIKKSEKSSFFEIKISKKLQQKKFLKLVKKNIGKSLGTIFLKLYEKSWEVNKVWSKKSFIHSSHINCTQTRFFVICWLHTSFNRFFLFERLFNFFTYGCKLVTRFKILDFLSRMKKGVTYEDT